MIAIGAFLVTLAISYVGTSLLLRLRHGHHFVDVPNERSSHEAPKLRSGGIAIVGSFIVAILAAAVVEPGLREFFPFLLGTVIIFAVGVVDDWRSLHAAVRFSAQTAAAILVVSYGHVVDHMVLPFVGTVHLGVAAAPFTVVFILTSINFYNFIDGIDGLAAGTGFIAAVFVAIIAFMQGHSAVAVASLAVGGAALGFLQFNFPPSKLFMGDSGSTFLGFFFAFAAIAGNNLTPQIPFFVPVLILSALYVDAGLTLIRRAVKGERVLEAHHTHYYQRLLSLGLNHKQVVALEYALTVALGISAIVFLHSGGLFLAFLTGCWILLFGGLMLKVRSLERGDRLFWERRTVLVILADVVLIAAAYLGAYFLRMNFKLTEPLWSAVLGALPIVLVVRSACFFWFGLYRGVWKYTSTPDVLRIIKAVSTGSAIVVAILVLFYRFTDFPRSVFVIEFFLLIIAIGGVRFASRLFHEFGREALGAEVRRVAIIGAGDFAERTAREIRATKGKAVTIACYVDDDPSKRGLILQGVPIVGPIDHLPDICRRHRVDAVVLAIASLSDARMKDVLDMARAADVEFDRLDGLPARREPTAVTFDRIARHLGRSLPTTTPERVADFYAGKRVMVTYGGGPIGPPLVRELVAAGALVTVHVSSPLEAERFSGRDDNVRVYIGGIEREIDLTRLLGAVVPNVIVHCGALSATDAINDREYVWTCLIRTMESFRKTQSRYALDSFSVIHFHDDVDLTGFASDCAALDELLILNAPEFLSAAPKVLRMPPVLTGTRLSGILGGTVTTDDRFGVIENEAVSLCMVASASHATRSLFVPQAASFTAADVARAVSRTPATRPGVDPQVTDAALTYPSETLRGSVLPGLKEVRGPIYPMDDELFEEFTSGLAGSGLEERKHVTSLVLALLHARAAQSI